MKHVKHDVDFCVVGGGLSGLCAAVAAARRGARVILMHDRPVPGGNASSEIRMWVCGAAGENNRETGLIEELLLLNRARNPEGNWSIWDSLLYDLARSEPNLTLLLNCSCNQVEMDGNRIASVTGWQLTTETWHTVEADLFADCSGDSILAPLTGAEFRVGREARREFGESLAPDKADSCTMGMSCLLQARETDRPQPFTPPSWAASFPSEDDLGSRHHDLRQWSTNFWWIELGGDRDSIHDTETLRDELLGIVFGIWDHIKNHGDHGAENWTLDWVGFLPGKRESRRYLGDHLLTQGEILAGGKFPDVVAYGGWPLDDHFPAGFHHRGERPNTWEKTPAPYGIPYRCLYSRNVSNLFFAGRNISATHIGISSTRVMATCALLGQAAGTAAALAAARNLGPRALGREAIGDLQQALLEDDCFLPDLRRDVPALTMDAELSASGSDPEPLRNGIDRPVGSRENGWSCEPGGWVAWTFDRPRRVKEVRLVFDSDLNRRGKNLPCSYPLDAEPMRLPDSLVRAFRVEVLQDGEWKTARHVGENTRRLVRVPLGQEAGGVRLVLESTWGNLPQIRCFGFDVRD